MNWKPTKSTGLDLCSQIASMKTLLSPPVFPPEKFQFFKLNIYTAEARQDFGELIEIVAWQITCGPLVIQLLQESKSAIGSTSPYHAHRWLPLGHDGFLPDQPRVSVHLSIPEAFSGPDPGYLCFTHILQVKPIKRYENKPPCPYRLLNELRLRET
jgi:hypothetical protein